MIRSVGIVGYGNFGKLVHALLERHAPEVTVRVYSSRATPDLRLFFPLGEVAQCDAVVLCVPIHAFEKTVEKLLPIMGWASILVDVATVKLHTVEVLERLAAGRRWIATHPMFGPESYAKHGYSVAGLRIVVAKHTLGREEYTALRDVLLGVGFSMIEKSAQDHDRDLARTLFLTHYIGQVVGRAGFSRTDIDTLSFGYLMDAVESVKNDTNLFRDVYDFNPYCKGVVEEFYAKEREVRSLLTGHEDA